MHHFSNTNFCYICSLVRAKCNVYDELMNQNLTKQWLLAPIREWMKHKFALAKWCITRDT